MPGGRLTAQERQQIALGLADDLAYAEIARRLDRPTSTVTREVMRHGGPGAYRADLAHRSAQQAAHRRRPAATARNARVSRAAGRGTGQDDAALRAYEETFTTLLMQSGLPRMSAGVLTLLYVADSGSLTAAELVERLEVSPASVSKAVALLENLGLIRRERVEGRRERYAADGDAWYQSMVAAARSNAQLAQAAREGVGVLGRETPAGARLENMARFMDFVGESITRAAEQARELLHTPPAPAADGEEAPGA
ncbi:MarR family transcriptional regulator [Isoptericola sp. NPDC057653]|uniref:GbsR/MarR family transcriptional regulator n=1 Tax=Isoptericola sp. NPDC057653 TaxID=3346195 RepID=UPI00367BC960